MVSFCLQVSFNFFCEPFTKISKLANSRKFVNLLLNESNEIPIVNFLNENGWSSRETKSNFKRNKKIFIIVTEEADQLSIYLTAKDFDMGEVVLDLKNICEQEH